MQYPLYDYYYESDLTLDEIIEHYSENFYLRKHGRDKYEKVLKKVSESDKVMKLFNTSFQQKLALTYMDFGATINEIMWFFFQSNDTQALAILTMASFWNVNVNSHLHLRSEENLRDEALKVFKKFSMYGEMTQEEFEKMTNPKPDYSFYENEDDDEGDAIGNNSGCVNGSENNKSYHILNFYLDCSYWHKQEDEIKKSPLILPIQIVDVDKEDEMVEKYKVRNLPTLILVDGEETEIHRWVGVTPTAEINSYLSNKGYANNIINNERNNVPPITKEDFLNNQELVLTLLAEDATPEIVKTKLEILLGKRRKTAEYLKIEQELRATERRLNENIIKKVASKKYQGDIKKVTMSDFVLCDDTDELYDEYHKAMDVLRQKADLAGVCYTIIHEEIDKELESSLKRN